MQRQSNPARQTIEGFESNPRAQTLAACAGGILGARPDANSGVRPLDCHYLVTPGENGRSIFFAAKRTSDNQLLMASKVWRRLAICCVVLCGSATIVWTSLGEWKLPSIGPRQQDYYNLLASGFRQGSLALDIEVPVELKRANDPWDPLKRPPVHTPADVSYFNGHYYLYFGVIPAVVVFWSFHAATGHDLPLVYGTLAFSLGGFLIAGWLWLRITRDHFPRASVLKQCAGILAIGLAGGQLVLVRRISIWEPPIVAGHFFMVCLIASGYRAMRSNRPWSWLAICGLSLGLAVGSRPTLAVGGVGLVVIVLAVGAGGFAAQGRIGILLRSAQATLAAGLPLAAIVAGLLAYNHVRFGDPFEFGIKYQLSQLDPRKARLFSATYVHYNFSHYFLRSPQWGRYFPFFHPVAAPRALPPGYYGSELVYGALIVCPVLWWALCLPAMFWHRHRETALLGFAGMLAATACATTIILLFFNTATARYEADFMPWLVWLSLLGWASLEHRLATAAPRRIAVIGPIRAAFLASAMVSVGLAFCASADLHGILVFENPEAYRQISRVFNTPTALAERLFKFPRGPIDMDVTFAESPPGSSEPLLVTGVEYQRDYVFVHYKSATVVSFGFMGSGGNEINGPDVSIEPGHRYRIQIECGSLYPPEGHPFFNGWSDTEIHSVKQWATIELDGHSVYGERASCHDASPGTIQVGKDTSGGPYGSSFSGFISDVHRGKWSRPQMDLSLSGDFKLNLTLPGEDEPATQPLIIAGRTANADLLGIKTVDRLHYALVYECWGAGLWQSEPITMPEVRTISLRIRFGPLLEIDESSPLAILGRSLVIWQGDSPVWWHRTMRPLDPRPKSGFSANAIGSTGMALEFEGRRNVAGRDSPPKRWLRGPFSAIEMDLAGRGGGSEPIVVTGHTGHSDTLAINWLPNSQAELIYDHSGGAVRISPIFNWPDGGMHRLNVSLPSFPLLDAEQIPEVGTGEIRVLLDGKDLWEQVAQFFPAQSSSLAIGRNRVSSAFASEEMQCVVADIRQMHK